MLTFPLTTGTKTKNQKVNSTFVPLDWQLSPFRDKASVMLLTGSAGGGKTRLAAEKIHAYCLKYPGTVGIVGRKDKTTARRSVVQVLLYRVMSNTKWGIYNKTEGVFQYFNGSRLWVVGMRNEEQREQLRSIDQDGAVDIAWMEEANKFSEIDHNEILARMRGKSASWSQIIYSTNPDSPTHWIYRRLIQGGQASVHYSHAKDNPNNPPEYLQILDSLTGVQKLRLADGKWVQAEGAIYENYDPSIHLIDEADLPEIRRWVVGIDFGYTNPFVASLWGLDADDRLYLVKQIYKTKTLVEDHAPKIAEMIGDLRIEAFICDHDAEDRATLERHLGIATTTAYKSVSPGIQAVSNRLKVQKDGKPRLFIVRSAVANPDPYLEEGKKPTSTEDEFPGYSWATTPEGKPIREEPNKVNDHGMDEMRYIVAYVDNIQFGEAWSFGNPFD